MSDPTCAWADERLDELALGLLPTDEAEAVLAHVSGCARCRAELDELSATADRLLVAAPAAEPPAGFEARAVEAMGGGSGRWASRARRIAVAALLVAGAASIGVAVGRASTSDHVAMVTASVTADGSVLTMALDGAEPGETYHCSVRTPDGHVAEVGAWAAHDGSGVWRVPLSPDLQDATQVVISDDAGHTLATAPLR